MSLSLVLNQLIKKKVLVISLVISISLLFSSVFAFADDYSSPDLEPAEEISVETLRVSPSDTSGFHAVILTLIGDYNPIVKTTAYQYPAGTGYQTRYQVDVEPDWSWICTCAVFIVIIYCLFRLVGGLFSCKR